MTREDACLWMVIWFDRSTFYKNNRGGVKIYRRLFNKRKEALDWINKITGSFNGGNGGTVAIDVPIGFIHSTSGEPLCNCDVVTHSPNCKSWLY